MVEIKSVIKKSPADKDGLKGGDLLLKVNSHEINDFLDYQFYTQENRLTIEYERKGSVKSVLIKKDEYDDLGLEFETYLMDKERRCKNKCIFCFIDQNPKGMRESIYFKDDDARLGFLFGNYITLTNLSERDVERIIEMHISPVNISVHTMNKDLRVQMMKNKNAGECLDIIKHLAENGIEINTQLVLCPGINDGEELKYSLQKLSELYPGVQSIAAVPVGVTKHREGLFEMPEYTKETASEVIDIITSFGDSFKEKHGTRLCYAADEFYLKAGRKIPDAEYYNDFPQLENGVGMWALLESEFTQALEECEIKEKQRRVTVVTGQAAYPLIKSLAEKAMNKIKGLDVNVVEAKNKLLGKMITVSGLLCGRDIADALDEIELGEELLIPPNCLRSEGDMFLDDMTVTELSKELGVKVTANGTGGDDLLFALLGGM
ncbi:MAG: DUF512 domain-containing protein [Clostridia bacterium]|nr:DUF512 domain-containing protein [Clostridia bacterium]